MAVPRLSDEEDNTHGRDVQVVTLKSHISIGELTHPVCVTWKYGTLASFEKE